MSATPRPFGSYELLRRIAIGATSEVWRARPKQRKGEERSLLLKRLLPHLADDPEAIGLFLMEAKLGALLQHPNIVRILEFGEAERIPYIAREFVHGESLDTVMREARHTPGVLSPVRAVSIMASVCEALRYAFHRVDPLDRPQPLIHRELAGRHILLGYDGEVRVMGFGAHPLGNRSEPVRAGLMPGRLEQLAPEQIAGQEQDQRTDVFCAGLVLYELLTGMRPFKRDSPLATVHAVHECKPLPPSRVAPVPESLDPLVMKALARAQEDRYQDPADFLSALHDFLDAQNEETSPGHLSGVMRALFPKSLSAT